MSRVSFKKLGALTVIAALLGTAISGLSPSKASAAPVIVSKIVTGSNGKSYVEVDGKPFMYENVENMGTVHTKGYDLSSITGFSNPLPLSWLENVFEKTKAAGYGMISLFLPWNDIEPVSQGDYDWTVIDQYIDWANEYDLRMSFTWLGSDANGGTRLPGFAGGWHVTVPEYLQNWQTYWNTKGTPPASAYTSDYMFYATKTGTAGAYIKSSEISAMTALFDHLATYDTNHRLISIMIENENHNIPDSWMSDVAAAVKNSDHVVVVGQHQQKAQYRAINNFDFVGFDDYSGSVSNKLYYLNLSPTPLKIQTETGGNSDNLSSFVVAAIANGGWMQAWELNDGYGGTLGMYETTTTPDYPNWTLGTIPTLKYGAQKNKRLQQALTKAYWVVAQGAPSEMVSFNVEYDFPSSTYSATKSLNGRTIGFKSDADSKGFGSVGLAVQKNNSYYLLSDTGTTVNFYTREAPTSATYGYQDENGNWVSQGNVTVTAKSDGTWEIPYNPSQVVKVDLPAGGTNLALNKTVTTSSSYSSNQNGPKAVDGNNSTQWTASNNTFNQWLSVDLGGRYDLTSVKQTFAETDNSNYKYKIEGSTDNSTWTTLVDRTGTGVTTNSTITETVSGTYRYVRLTITGITNNHSANSKSFEVYGNIAAPLNLALGKAVTVSSSYSSQVGSNAVDGLQWTQWTAPSAANQWLSVDLGSIYSLSTIRQTFAETDNSNYKYKIEGSTDNSTWTTLVDRTGTGVNTSATIFENVSGSYRYLKLTVVGVTNNHWINSKEFEVY